MDSGLLLLGDNLVRFSILSPVAKYPLATAPWHGQPIPGGHSLWRRGLGVWYSPAEGGDVPVLC